MTDQPQRPEEEERTTDENEPVSVPVPEPVTEPKTEPVADVTPPAGLESEPAPASDADADEGEDEEPLEATRLSPYSVAAFAVSLLALFQAPQNIFSIGAQAIPLSQLLRFVLPTLLLPVGASIAGLYLAWRGEEEIFVSEGKLGGVGLYRAARIVSAIVLTIIVVALVILFFLAEQPQPQPQFG
jgi:hypothetical protein